MRILLLNDRIPPENRGGAGRVVWLLACGLRDAGHDVHIIVTTPGDSFQDVREGIPTYHLHANLPDRWRAYFSLYNPQTMGELRRLFTQIQPDVVNAHNIHVDLSFSSLSLAQRMGIPAVFNSHDVMPFSYAKLSHFVSPHQIGPVTPEQYRLPPLHNLKRAHLRYNPVRNVVIRHILRQHTQARVAVSHALRQALEANGLPPFEVVYNGIDPNAFQVSPEVLERVRSRLGLEGRRVILFAGRLTAKKGILLLLQALDRVVQTMPDALLLLLTTGSPQWNLDDFRHLNAEQVRFGGWLDNDELIAAFHLADVVTQPSVIMDSLPTINLEAMAARKPVLASCFGGSPEIVVDGETGYIVNPLDIDSLADRLTDLLAHSSLRQRLGNAGHQRLLKHFTLARQIEQMVAIYEKVNVGNSADFG